MMTLNEMFEATAQQQPERPAFRWRTKDGWQALSYADAAKRVRAIALGLRTLGLKPGERVAILAENRVEWALMDLATLSAAGVVVPIYPTLPDNQIEILLRDSGAAFLVTSGGRLLDRAKRLQSTALRQLISMDEVPAESEIISLAQVEKPDGADTSSLPAVREEDLAAIVYTSGTTGEMKGVMLSHANVVSNIQAALTRFQVGPTDEMLSFLPLSHTLERTAGLYVPLYAGACVSYADSIMTVARDATEVRPTILICVPRFLESVQSRILGKLESAPPTRRRLFAWALNVGKQWQIARRKGRPGFVRIWVHSLADRSVLSKARAALGGRLRFVVCGGAALPIPTAEFFDSIGIPVAEGWGLTETSPVIAVNSPRQPHYGTVGPAIPGVEIRVAPDGELICRGPNVMQGYFNRPEATREAIDPDGWFHTGDIGEIDAQGLVRITDRKKNLLVLANGKNVAPAPIEARLKESPLVSEVLLVGDGRSAVGALIVVAAEPVKALAKQEEVEGDLTEIVNAAPIRRRFKSEIDRQCSGLAEWERVKRFSLLAQPWTIESGELTPTLKPRRKVIVDRFARNIDAMYGGEL